MSKRAALPAALCVLGLGLSMAFGQQKKAALAFPPAEEAIKNDEGPWGMPFSDLVAKFEKRAAAFEAGYRQSHSGAPSLDYVVGVETSLRKVFRNKWWFKGQVTDTATLSACRNESESFQIAVMPRMGKELKEVLVAWTGLTGPGEIPMENLKLYQVLFIKTLPAQYPARHTGYWPDALMPLEPFSVGGLDLGLLWCDVKVPKAARPGDYEGTITIAPQGQPPIDVKLRLHVWDFDLPDRIPFRMTVWPETREPKDRKQTMPSEKFLDYCALFLEHHIDPATVGSEYIKAGDFSVLDKNLQFCFDRGLLCFRARRSRNEEEMKAYYDHVKEKGWLDKGFIYGAQDEPSLEQFNEIVIPDTANIREKFPGLRVLLATEWHPNLDRGVDIFMTDVSTGFELYGMPERPRGREELWWYFCHLPIRIDMTRPLVDAPNMLIDNDAVEHRLAYWMMWKYEVRGCFIYNGTSWPGNLNADWPAEEWVVQDKPYAYPYAGIHNGNGYLVYPGPHPSVRLKVLRDGAEDYGYLLALKAARDSLSGEAQARADALLAVPGDLLVDTHYFNRDPNAIQTCRAKIADLLDAAAK